MEDKDYEAVRGEHYFTPYDDIAMPEPKENDDGYLSVGVHLKTTSGCWYNHMTWAFRRRRILDANLVSMMSAERDYNDNGYFTVQYFW